MIEFNLIVYTKNYVALINTTLLLNLIENPKIQHIKTILYSTKDYNVIRFIVVNLEYNTILVFGTRTNNIEVHFF